MIYKDLFNKLKVKKFNSLSELKEDNDFKTLQELEKSPEFQECEDKVLFFHKKLLEKRSYNLIFNIKTIQINEHLNKFFHVYYKPSTWFILKQFLTDTNILKPCILTCKNSKYKVIDIFEVNSTVQSV